MSDLISDASLYACLYRPPMPGQMAQPTSHFQGGTQANDQRLTTNDQRAVSAEGLRRGRLTDIAAEFSPRYEQHRADLVSIDVRGLSRLLGTPKMIGAEMRRESASRGVRVHVAIAPTRISAVVLAIARPGLTVVPAGGVAEALAPIPLTVLEQLHEEPFDSAQGRPSDPAQGASEAITALKRWGLRTLGELAALPAGDLAARLGRSGRMWQAIARGVDTRPLVPMQAEERFEGRLELEWPIEGAEPLSFVLTRLLEPLSTRLERRDRAAAVLHVVLGLVTREVHACRLELPSPLRDVRALRTLALLDFEAHPPSAAIDTVTVIIEPTPGRILQHALFSRPHPTPEQLSTLLARLGALIGQDRIGAPSTVDSFRPGAFAMKPFAIERQTSELQIADCRLQIGDSQSPTSALRRCRRPIPARVATDAHQRPLRVSTERRGFAGGAVLSCAGPWRTSGAWWEDMGSQQSAVSSENLEVRSPKSEGGNQKRETGAARLAEAPDEPMARRREGGAWSRDEWDVALADGAVYRIFRDRVTDAWFIDGVVD
jgi:protein ImuB